MYKEWTFDHIEDLRAQTGRCNCGHKPIRYKYYFRNTVTGNITYVGSKCKTQFKSTPKSVTEAAKKLSKTGLKGVRCVNKKPGGVQFAFRRGTLLDHHKGIFKRFFGKIPYKVQSDQEPLLWTSIPGGYADKFEVDALYDIRITMMRGHDNGLKLKMNRFKIHH